MHVKNKFYVGSTGIGTTNKSGWAYPTVQAAIEHAKQLLGLDPERKEAIIVQIIRVVRPVRVVRTTIEVDVVD